MAYRQDVKEPTTSPYPSNHTDVNVTEPAREDCYNYMLTDVHAVEIDETIVVFILTLSVLAFVCSTSALFICHRWPRPALNIHFTSLRACDLLVAVFGASKMALLHWARRLQVNYFMADCLFQTACLATCFTLMFVHGTVGLQLARPGRFSKLDEKSARTMVVLLWNISLIMGFLPILIYRGQFTMSFFTFFNQPYLLDVGLTQEICLLCSFFMIVLTACHTRKHALSEQNLAYGFGMSSGQSRFVGQINRGEINTQTPTCGTDMSTGQAPERCAEHIATDTISAEILRSGTDTVSNQSQHPEQGTTATRSAQTIDDSSTQEEPATENPSFSSHSSNFMCIEDHSTHHQAIHYGSNHNNNNNDDDNEIETTISHSHLQRARCERRASLPSTLFGCARLKKMPAPSRANPPRSDNHPMEWKPNISLLAQPAMTHFRWARLETALSMVAISSYLAYLSLACPCCMLEAPPTADSTLINFIPLFLTKAVLSSCLHMYYRKSPRGHPHNRLHQSYINASYTNPAFDEDQGIQTLSVHAAD